VKLTRAGLLLFVFAIITGFHAAPAAAQHTSVTAQIVKALKNANASQLAAHLNASVDLAIPNNEGTYSKKQAEQILKMFFSKNPVKNFSLEHTGNSNNGSKYLIGSYENKAGKSFRVYLLIKGRNDTELIQQLQFEEE
jgi:archaellum component FlaG (FlaF/FlaG flagellin family)